MATNTMATYSSESNIVMRFKGTKTIGGGRVEEDLRGEQCTQLNEAMVPSKVYARGTPQQGQKQRSIEEIVRNLKCYKASPDTYRVNALILHRVELELLIMSQCPKERARFICDSLAYELQRQFLMRVNPWLDPPGFNSGYKSSIPEYGFVFPDLLFFNTTMISRQAVYGNIPGWNKGTPLLEALHSPFPYTYLALINDLPIDTISPLPTITTDSLVAKALSLAQKLHININNIYREFPDLNKFSYNNKYSLSTTDHVLPYNMPTLQLRGKEGSIIQTLVRYVLGEGICYLPVTPISSTECAYPAPMFLPVANVPLANLDRLFYDSSPHIILTPNFSIYDRNNYCQDATILSWWGDADTIDLVDWGPLAGKTVLYLYRPSDFHDQSRTQGCLNAVREKLLALGCNFLIVDLSDATFAPPLNQPPPNTQPDPYYSPVI